MERTISSSEKIQFAIDFQNYEEKALRMADEATEEKVSELVQNFQEALENNNIDKAEEVLVTLYQMSGEESFWEEG
jgi:hypothetical protein